MRPRLGTSRIPLQNPCYKNREPNGSQLCARARKRRRGQELPRLAVVSGNFLYSTGYDMYLDLCGASQASRAFRDFQGWQGQVLEMMQYFFLYRYVECICSRHRGDKGNLLSIPIKLVNIADLRPTMAKPVFGICFEGHVGGSGSSIMPKHTSRKGGTLQCISGF